MGLRNVKKYLSSRIFFGTFIPVVCLNAFLSMIISYPLLDFLGDQRFVHSLFSLVAFAGHYFLLNLVVGLVAYCFFFFLHEKLALAAMISAFSILQLVLIADTKIYALFRYHINPLVLNVLTTEGASDSITIGKRTIGVLLLIIAGILFAEIVIHRSLMNPAANAAGKKPSLASMGKLLFWAGLFLVGTEKAIFAYGDIVNNTAITQNARLFPLYQPITVKRFVSKVFNVRIDRDDTVAVSASRATVRYPKNAILFDPSAARSPNILLIIVDGLRFDMLNKETMPNVWEFSRESIVFTNHYSGGNGTRFGVFSLLYGINGTYWHNFLAKGVSPVLIDSLIEKGYECKVLSSTRLTFPEFRRTAFLRIPECIEDAFGDATATERDKIITEKFIQYASREARKKPFFAFVFYDASHQPYSYPPEFEKFRPAGEGEINYFKDIGKDKIHILRNRYKNAVYYNDHLIGRIIETLRKTSLLDDTVVVITGDHGEEFFENGYFGHTSAFNDYQTRTVFVLHYPGAGHSVVERLTGHADLVPTLMESLGCVSPPEDYSQGQSLLRSGKRAYITSANWDTAALIDDEYVTIFSTEMYKLQSLEVRRKSDYTPLASPRDAIRQRRANLLDVSLKMAEFYR